MALPALGLIGAGAQLLGKVFGGNEDDPRYVAPQASVQEDAQLGNLEKRASQSEDEIAADTLKGTDAGKALLGGGPSMGGLGGVGGNELAQAIQSRAQKSYGEHYADLGRKAKADAYSESSRRKSQASDLRFQRQNIENAIKMQAQTAQIQAEAARNDVINSIVGGAGQMAGMAIGGAMAGQPKTGNFVQKPAPAPLVTESTLKG